MHEKTQDAEILLQKLFCPGYITDFFYGNMKVYLFGSQSHPLPACIKNSNRTYKGAFFGNKRMPMDCL